MKVRGFTPVMDNIKNDVGGTGAHIYGVMWRYSKMSALGVCTAKQTTIAERAGRHRDTVLEYQKILEEKGYITNVGCTGRSVSWACNMDIAGEFVMRVEEEMPEIPATDVGNSGDLYKKVPKRDKDMLDFVLDFGKKNVALDSEWFPPDVGGYLNEFTTLFKGRFKREASKSEHGFWIKECREWRGRKYLTDDVQRAWQYCIDNETTITSPKSITWAFDQLSPSDDYEASGFKEM